MPRTLAVAWHEPTGFGGGRVQQFTFVGRIIQPVPPTTLTLAAEETSSRKSPHHDDGGMLHPSTDLDVEAALGTSNGRILLAAGGVDRILMHFDMTGIQKTQLALGVGGQHRQQLRPESGLTPATRAGVNRVPRSISGDQIAPRNTRAQDEDHRLEH